MPTRLIIAALFPLALVFSSCRIGQSIKDISGDFRGIRQTVVPADSLMMDLTSGVLSELSSAESEEKLDTISARINRILTLYLNQTFQELDPGPVGKKLTQGALDPIFAKETEERLQNLIQAVSQKAGDDLSAAIRKVIGEATSQQSKDKLNSVLLSLVSEANSDAISSFINRALNNVRFDTIGQHLGKDLIASNLKPEIDSLVRTAVRSIFEEINKDEASGKFFGNIKNILFLGLGLLGAIIGLFFWWNRRKTVNLNRVLINAIEDLDDKTGQDVKKVVAQKARHEGLLPDLDKVLEREHLLKRKEMEGRN